MARNGAANRLSAIPPQGQIAQCVEWPPHILSSCLFANMLPYTGLPARRRVRASATCVLKMLLLRRLAAVVVRNRDVATRGRASGGHSDSIAKINCCDLEGRLAATHVVTR